MELSDLFAAVLRIPAGQVQDATAPANTAAWTSMAHMALVVAMEATYGVTLSAAEIRALTSVGTARQLLAGKGVDVG